VLFRWGPSRKCRPELGVLGEVQADDGCAVGDLEVGFLQEFLQCRRTFDVPQLVGASAVEQGGDRSDIVARADMDQVDAIVSRGGF
jgi:hypothetical protein